MELATLACVDWLNHQRLLEPLGYLPPAEFEQRYHQHQLNPARAAVSVLERPDSPNRDSGLPGTVHKKRSPIWV